MSQQQENIFDQGGMSAVNRAIDTIAQSVETTGDSSLAGIEQEVITVRKDGKPIAHTEYQIFLANLMRSADPDVKVGWGESLNGGEIIVGGQARDGDFCPEVSSITTEFATKPVQTAHEIADIMANIARAYMDVTERMPYAALSSAMPPAIKFDDIAASGAPVPYARFAYSFNNIMRGERPEVSATSFGNASVHNNQGFSDPERMVRYLRACLYMQPTMIAMTANAPLWDKAQAVDNQGRPLLSRRSWLQTNYEQFLGYTGLQYLYPSFLLDFERDFTSMMQGYMDQPLDRTLANGQKVQVGKMTMKDYLMNGFRDASSVRHFATPAALNMMFSEPMVDVRMRPFGGPRVETRAHDGGMASIAPALNAFYRGIAVNLDEAENLMRQYGSADAVRKQRVAVCYTALDTEVKMQDDTIRTQGDLAARLLAIADRGLTRRGMDESVLLAPLQDIVDSRVTQAQQQLVCFEECGRDLISHGARFMERFRFGRTPAPTKGLTV